MAGPNPRMLQNLVQRVLDEQKAMREFLEVQFAMIRSRDFRLEGRDNEMRALEAVFGGRERRITALEKRPPAE